LIDTRRRGFNNFSSPPACVYIYTATQGTKRYGRRALNWGKKLKLLLGLLGARPKAVEGFIRHNRLQGLASYDLDKGPRTKFVLRMGGGNW